MWSLRHGWSLGSLQLLDGLRTIQSGGQTVASSTYTDATWAKPPARFEGGLGNFSGMMATGAAIDYLAGLDMNAVHEHEIKLNEIMTNGVKTFPAFPSLGLKILEKEAESVFLMDGLPAHDVALLGRSRWRDGEKWSTLRSLLVCRPWPPPSSLGPQPISTIMKRMSVDLWIH